MNKKMFKIRKSVKINMTEKTFKSVKDYSRKSDKQRLLQELRNMDNAYDDTVGYAEYD